MGKQLAADSTKAIGETGTKLIGRPPDHKPTLIAPRKRAYSVKEAAEELNLSVPGVYVLLARKELYGKKIGSRLVILGEELDRFLAECQDATFDMPSITRNGGAAHSQ
jgi:excisionase family DNA binding protein